MLLDAGAGNAWRYHDRKTGHSFTRSEGLAVASLDMFAAGLSSSDPAHPLRVDHAALARIDAATLARHFQVDGENPLVGLEQRSVLLRRLGTALSERPDMFGRTPARPGNLVDCLLGIADQRRIAASAVLAALLESLSSIWPSGLTLDGFAVGDAGYHPAARAEGRTDRIVPFHKLSQWLTYSLLEPLEAAGLGVERLHELTALPEYRNGGLLVDLGVIRPRVPIDPLVRHEVSSELVVEWRALTVALMDPLVDLVRARLDLDAELHHAEDAAGRHLERRAQDRAGVASAGRSVADSGCGRRHGVLSRSNLAGIAVRDVRLVRERQGTLPPGGIPLKLDPK